MLYLSSIGRSNFNAVLALIWLCAGLVRGIPVSLCSFENTGSDSTPNDYNLQSLGHCRDQCGGYAFAIAQQYLCWCSNYAPSDTVSTTTCNQPCHGYPYEFCGSESGAFSYLQLGTPSGTIDSNPSPSNVVPGTIYQTRTVVNTIVNTIVSNNVILLTTALVETQVITQVPDPTNTGVSTHFVTVGDTVRTVTSGPETAPAGSSPNINATRTTGLSNGAVAGITVGVIAAAAIIGVLLFCLWKKRRSNGSESSSINRNTSVLSKVGLLRHGSTGGNRMLTSDGGQSSTATHVASQPPRLDTDMPPPMMGSGQSSAGGSGPMLERRDSRPLFRDHRLNPNALMVHSDTSRTSVGTLQDDKDYSRPLEVRNPDPT